MERLYKFICALITVVVLSFVFGCKSAPLVVEQTQNYVVITVDSGSSVDENTTLLEYMQALKGNGQLDFEINNGMVISINGISNASDWSSCWMLYTSDEDNANSAWGTIDYDGTVYASAVFGAEKLIVKHGCKYIWVYKGF